MNICPVCGTELCEETKEISFLDDFAESTFKVDITAEWCDSCNHYKLDVD